LGDDVRGEGNWRSFDILRKMRDEKKNEKKRDIF